MHSENMKKILQFLRKLKLLDKLLGHMFATDFTRYSTRHKNMIRNKTRKSGEQILCKMLRIETEYSSAKTQLL